MEQSVRVLVAISSMEIGGAERQVIEVCRLLQGEEFQFDVVAFAGGGPLEEQLRKTGARIHTFYGPEIPPPQSKAARAWRAGRTSLRLRRVLAKVRPDLMHSYLMETSALLAAARWPRRLPPFVFSKRSLVQWISRNRIYFPLARWTNRRADLILVNSNAVREDAIRKEGAPAERIRVVYNGVDTDTYRPGDRPRSLIEELRIPEGRLVVGMIANQHSYKGHQDVLRAFARLKSGDRVLLLCVGREGDDSENIRRLAGELNLSDRVIFAGPRSDVPEVLKVMDIVVSASHEEGFSNSILEAMAAGKAIVATAIGGTPEQITDGVTGLLVKPRTPEDLAIALEELIANRELRDRLGVAARRRAVERFSLDRLRSEMATLYRGLAGGLEPEEALPVRDAEGGACDAS